MDKITTPQAFQPITQPHSIRNVAIIAHIDHGKHTLTDLLAENAGINAQNNTLGTNATNEASKYIVVKPAVTPLSYTQVSSDSNQNSKEQVLINLIDSFSSYNELASEMTSALKVSDGALVLIDAIEGFTIQAELALRSALTERVKPVLIINKLDRYISELQQDSEVIYSHFETVIDKVNTVLSTYQHPEMGDLNLDPALGNVAFSSGIHKWTFTVKTFARIYAQKFGLPEEKLVKKLWGDNYFNRESNKWTTEPSSEGGQENVRGFIKFILDPILKLSRTALEGNTEQLSKFLEKIDLQLPQQDRELTGKPLVKAILSKWMGGTDSVLEMIAVHLPSPKTAQKYRVSCLYEGSQTDPCAQAMRECDPYGPLMIYVSRLVPTSDKQKFFAVGRVFSGIVSVGQKVRILGPQYRPGRKNDLIIDDLKGLSVQMGRHSEAINSVPCGNIVLLEGVDQYLLKTGTITDSEEANKFRSIKQPVLPGWKVHIEPKNPADLPKFIKGLSKIGKPEPLIDISKEDSGQYFISGVSELHVEVTLKDIAKDIECEIKSSPPVIPYRETILEKSAQICMAKSEDKHNLIYCQAEPLAEDLCKLIEDGKIAPWTPLQELSSKLVTDFNWMREDTEKIWAFGPNDVEANVLVDLTRENQYMSEAQESLVSAFEWAVEEGVLAGEKMRKMRFNILDLTSQANLPINPKTITPAARRVFYACELASKPILQEGIYSVQITTPMSHIGSVYQCLDMRKGTVTEEEPVNDQLVVVKGFIPVMECHGFASHLRSLTSGQAFPGLEFSHWNDMVGDPFDPTSKIHEIVKSIRKRKGLKEDLPRLEDYLDQL